MSSEVLKGITNRGILNSIQSDVKELFSAISRCPVHEERLRVLDKEVAEQKTETKELKSEVYVYIDKQFKGLDTRFEGLTKSLEKITTLIYGTMITGIFMAVLFAVLRFLKVI